MSERAPWKVGPLKDSSIRIDEVDGLIGIAWVPLDHDLADSDRRAALIAAAPTTAAERDRLRETVAELKAAAEDARLTLISLRKKGNFDAYEYDYTRQLIDTLKAAITKGTTPEPRGVMHLPGCENQEPGQPTTQCAVGCPTWLDARTMPRG